jgi:hypothetical protein
MSKELVRLPGLHVEFNFAAELRTASGHLYHVGSYTGENRVRVFIPAGKDAGEQAKAALAEIEAMAAKIIADLMPAAQGR